MSREQRSRARAVAAMASSQGLGRDGAADQRQDEGVIRQAKVGAGERRGRDRGQRVVDMGEFGQDRRRAR